MRIDVISHTTMRLLKKNTGTTLWILITGVLVVIIIYLYFEGRNAC